MNEEKGKRKREGDKENPKKRGENRGSVLKREQLHEKEKRKEGGGGRGATGGNPAQPGPSPTGWSGPV